MEANPVYNRYVGQQLADLGAYVGAMTPEALGDFISRYGRKRRKVNMKLTQKEKSHYQEMLKMWDALELTEKNRQIVEQYMAIRQPENVELLKEVEYQSLKKDWINENRWKCVDYFKYCRAKYKAEEEKRYVRFVVAVGGSTAYYVLIFHQYEYLNENSVSGYLTPEQWIALKAEDVVWNVSRLQDVTSKIKETNPDILREAMKLCCVEYVNAKLLVTALSLHYMSPVKVSGEQNEISNENQIKQIQIQEMIEFIVDSFIATIPDMLTEGEFSKEDIRKLKNFIEESEESVESISIILQGKQYNTYWITLFSSCIFLAIKHSKKFFNCLKITVLMDIENKADTTLDSCLSIHTRQWFEEHSSMLEEQLPMNIESYLIWCEKNEMGEAIKRISSNYPEKIKQVKDKMNEEEFLYLLYWVKTGNLGLYEELKDSFGDEFLIKMAYEIVGNWGVGCKMAQRYLLGEVEGEEIYPFIEKWRDRAIITVNMEKKIISLRKSGNQLMYQRMVALMALLLKKDFFVRYWIEERKEFQECEDVERYTNKGQFNAMIQIFSEEKIPVKYQLELLGDMCKNFNFQEGEKEIFFNYCIALFIEKKREWENEVTISSRSGNVAVRLLCIQMLNVYWEEYKGFLIDCVEEAGKQVQELLVTIYEGHKEWEEDIKELLYSIKVEEREVAVHVLAKWGIENYREELLELLENDKSKKLKKLIQHYLGMQIQKTDEELMEEIFKGGRKKSIQWISETTLPTVHKLDDSEVSSDYMKAILVAYATMERLGLNAKAKELAKKLKPKELTEYVKAVFYQWVQLGAEARRKWVLYFTSIHGGEEVIPLLYEKIQEWPRQTRGAIAVEAIKALTLNGSATALLLVEQVALKFKYPKTRVAAARAFEYAAGQFGITRAELEDRLIPCFGFDEQMKRTFDYGTRKFTVTIAQNLELFIVDDKGQHLKMLPNPGKQHEEEKAKAAFKEYKLLNREWKTFTEKQKNRLNEAFHTRRLWKVLQWKEFFIENLVMYPFAVGFVWGYYENGQLKETFCYKKEDGFFTVNKDNYELSETGMIGLVHSMELSEKELEAWKQQLLEYGIVQPIEQIL